MGALLGGLLVAHVLSVGLAVAASSPEGKLDRSFGHGGKVLARLPPTYLGSEFTSLSAGPDGSLILGVRRQGLGGGIEEAIERRGPRGRLDPGFGRGGTVATPGLAALTAGSYGAVSYVARTGDSCHSASLLHRLTPGGLPDARFGEGGRSAEVPIDAELVAPAPGGGILLAGRALAGPCGHDRTPSGEPALVRLRPDGSLDPAFGRRGVLLAADLGLLEGDVVGLAVTESGRIYLAGLGSLLALTPDGTPDPGFAGDGSVELPGAARVILAAPDGGVYVAMLSSRSCCSESGDYRLARYGPGGDLDPGFGTAGVAVADVGTVDEATALALAPGGGVLLAGESGNGGGCPTDCLNLSALVAFTPEGRLDPAFGEAGRLVLAIPARPPTQSSNLAGLLVTPAGRVLAAGGSGPHGDAFILGRESSGEADPGFGRLGSVTEIRTAPSSAEPAGLAIEPNGHILVTATSDARVHRPRPVLLNFEPDGRPDRDLGSGAGYLPSAAEGRVAVAGPGMLFSLHTKEGRAYVLRFGSRGRLDRLYGKEGEAPLPDRFDPRSLLARPDGSVIAVGRVLGLFGMAAYRLDPRGRVDRRFGEHGLALVEFGRRVPAEARGAVVEAGGRIVLFGSAGASAALAALTPGGRLDRGFAHGGRLRGFLGHGTRALLAVRAAGGSTLLACWREPASAPGATLLVRIDREGRLDHRFGSDGLARPPGGEPPLALFSGPRRSLLLAASPGRREGGVLIAGIRGDGRLDPRFGRRGLARLAVGQRRPFVPVAAATDRGGRVVVVGSAGAQESERGVELLRLR